MTTLETTSPAGGARSHQSEVRRRVNWRHLLSAASRVFSRPHRQSRIEDMPEWLQRDLGYEPRGPRGTQQVVDTAVRLLFGATR